MTLRLLKSGVNSSKSKDADDNTILFVRLEGGNYICLGRLAVAGYNLSASPVSIQWELLDYESLKASQVFRDVLVASD